MKKLKQALSLSLALVLSLAMAVPAFAAESKWKVEVVGKTNAEISLGKKTFTVRDWVISGTFKDDEFDMIGNIWTKTDSHQWTTENVYALSKGDEVVFTKGGESFEEFYMTAWSDPDGDGVYDQLIGNITSDDYSSTFLPANAAGPVRDFYGQTYTVFYMPSLGYLQQMGLTPDGYGSWDLCDTGGVSPVTELKMHPDLLLDIYGPNTIVNIATPDKSWSCTILVEVPLQPTTPTQPVTPPAEVKTANPTNDKLMVNGVAQNPTVYKIGGSNYFKIRDVAAVLNGTEKQFAVGYAGGKVTVTSGQPYEATGKELAGAPDAAKDASPSNDTVIIDGTEASLTVYKIGGANYFKLRDLGKALNFYVGWEAGKGVYIETGKPYSK